MSPAERWQRVQDLCGRAEPLTPAERDALLAAEPADLAADVRRLLGALAAEPLAAARPAAAQASAPALDSPAIIGPYRITQRLGRGGTGTVYEAEITRAGVTQTVAVKLLDSYLDPEAAARFEREQQMLARLDHPAITKVLDAGLTNGQPYLVMEKVAGQPLDDYCRDLRLGMAGRLQLLIDVCEAVQAAHRNLIVHLDLKPSNILVTREGQVKLLDFGTAKLLDPAGSLTTTRQLTPMYASPEQLRGDAVTTACDVYSLGLILYELLTGGWPFASRASLVAVSERAAGTTSTRPLADAITPSAAQTLGLTIDRARGLLKGDLEVIVRKALSPEPHRRYDSPHALAEDLRAHLDQRPVRAQRQTTLYRVRKYAARHRGAVSLTALLLIALAGALGTAFWQQRQKIEEGRKAQATARFLGWLLQSSNPIYGGKSGTTLVNLAERAGQRLDRGDIADPALAASLQSALGYLALTDGRPDVGSRMISAAVARARASGQPAALTNALSTKAQEELSAGRCAEALKLFAEGDPLAAAHASQIIPTDRAAYSLARAFVKQACEKDPAGLATWLQKVEREMPFIANDANSGWIPPRMAQALFYNGLANLYTAQRKTADARRAAQTGLSIAQREPESNSVQVALYRSLAAIEYAEGSPAKSAAALGQAVEKLEGGYSSAYEQIRMRVMWAARRAEAGDAAPAVEILNRAVQQTHDKASELGPQRWMILVDAAFGYYRAKSCQPVPALVREADEISGGQMPPQWKGNRLAAEAQCLVELGRPAEARPIAQAALAALQPYLLPQSPLKKRLEEASR